MIIQKINNNIFKPSFCNKNVSSNNSPKKRTRFDDLKENFATSLIIMGDEGFIVSQSLNKETKDSFKKSNPILDKLLFVAMGACVVITIVEIVLAIKEYIEDKKANNTAK